MIKIFFKSSFLALAIIGMFTSLSCSTYVLRISCPPLLTNTKGMWCYYKGKPYDLSEKWCLIQEETDLVCLTIFISEKIEWQADGNNVRYLKRIPSQGGLWYDLTRTIRHDGATWTIQKRELTDVSLRLPENTIYVQVNPDLIDGVNMHNAISEPVFVGTNAIELPTIRFKKNTTQELFDEKSVYSVMALPDLKPIHRESRKIFKTENPLMVSMITVR